MKRVAVCLSGCMRSWKTCIPTYEKEIMELGQRLGEEFRVFWFAHTWEFNTVTSHHRGEEMDNLLKVPREKFCVKYLPVSEEEIAEFKRVVPFEKVRIGTKEESDRAYSVFGALLERYNWAGPMLYSIEQSCKLKQEYEKEVGIEFDLCIRVRSDLKLEVVGDDRWNGMGIPTNLVFGGYSTPYLGDSFIPVGMVDTFWMAASKAFDVSCSTYTSMQGYTDRELEYFARPSSFIEELIWYNVERSGIFFLADILRRVPGNLINVNMCRDFENELLNRV